jgi:hypothetical protein
MNDTCCKCGQEMTGYRRRDCICNECREKMQPKEEDRGAPILKFENIKIDAADLITRARQALEFKCRTPMQQANDPEGATACKENRTYCTAMVPVLVQEILKSREMEKIYKERIGPAGWRLLDELRILRGLAEAARVHWDGTYESKTCPFMYCKICDALQRYDLHRHRMLINKEYLGVVITDCGHGHVHKRPDGKVAKCGGPGMCEDCAQDERTLKEAM